MKNVLKVFIAAVLFALIALLANLLTGINRENVEADSIIMNPGATTGEDTEIPHNEDLIADDKQAQETESRTREKIYSQMRERYGQHYAVHEMNPMDVGEEEFVHLGTWGHEGGAWRHIASTRKLPQQSLGGRGYYRW